MTFTGQENNQLTVSEGLSRAKKFEKKGDYRNALELYKLILEAAPRNKIAKKGLKRLSSKVVSANYLNELINLYEQGKLHEVISVGERLLKDKGNDSKLHNTLGVAFKALGEPERADSYFKEAISLEPAVPEFHNNHGSVLIELERFDEARIALEEALALRKDYAEAHCNLGVLLMNQEKFDEAEKSLTSANKCDPESLLILYNSGRNAHGAGDFLKAQSFYSQVIQKDQMHIGAQSNIGHCFKELGLLQKARSSYERALEIRPEFVNDQCSLIEVLVELGSYEEALAYGQKTFEAHPNDPLVLRTVARVFHFNDEDEQAERCFTRAIELEPENNKNYHDLGIVKHKRYQLAEARKNIIMALKIKPNSVSSLTMLAIIMGDFSEHQESVDHFKKALSLKPDNGKLFANLCFGLNYHPTLTPEEVFAHYQQFDKRFCLPYKKNWFKFDIPPPLDRQIKVGYLSPDFKNHTVARFMQPILEKHDRERFSIHAYAELALKDEDEVTGLIKQHLDSWTSTYGMSDEDLANKIRDDGIDILVDLAGHTEGNRLPMIGKYKPAPVVASYSVGFAYTTGLSAVDYFLAPKDLIAPDGDHLFSEQPLGLVTGVVYQPITAMGDVNEAPVIERGYITFGSLTRSIRINRKMVSVWSELLKRVARSRLVLNNRCYKDETLKSNIISMFEEEGVSRERLELGYDSPPWDVYRGIDIGLDCFPHNSGTTLAESLYLGLPFITLRGTLPVGRIGSTYLNAINRGEWIAETSEEYVNKAVALAEDINLLSSIRQSLRSELLASPAMDAVNVTRELEKAYLSMCTK